MGQGTSPRGNSFRSGCAIGLVVGALIAALVVTGALKENPESRRSEFRRSIEEKTKPQELQATVELRDADLVIMNQGPDDWTNVLVRLNYHSRWRDMEVGNYQVKVRRLGAGEQRTIPLKEFARPEGTRFNIDQVKVVLLDISCETPNGPGQWSTDIFN
jgi:hypothetical protein